MCLYSTHKNQILNKNFYMKENTKPLFFKSGKGPSTKDVRQMGRGVVLKFRTFPDGGRGVVCESSDVRKFLRAIIKLIYKYLIKLL